MTIKGLTIQEFRPNLWMIQVGLEGFDVRSALIVGRERAVVWDTLSHPRDMELVAPLIPDRELVIVYSHADWDHIWGTAGLPHQRKLIIGHTHCRARFDADVPTKLQEMRTTQPERWDAVKLVAPNLTFSNELSLDLGAVTLNLHHLPGHTHDSIVGFIPEQGILLAGDTVETPLPVTDSDSPLGPWIAELERWERDPRLQTVIPAHGGVGGRDILRRNVAYLQSLRDGSTIELPETLDEFYRQTHEVNLRYWRGNV
jgi:glyoxylase-like metal-dependent hydrolase (beta-lactamase superfamily II)